MYDSATVSIIFLVLTIFSLILPIILMYYTYKAWRRVLTHFDRVEELLEKIAAKA